VIVGDPFVAAVKQQVKGSTGFNINYPANADSNSSSKGAQMVVEHLTSQPKACPNQKFVVTGYSQGASVVRKAMPKIPESTQRNIIAIVTFGDPGRWQKTTSRWVHSKHYLLKNRLQGRQQNRRHTGRPWQVRWWEVW